MEQQAVSVDIIFSELTYPRMRGDTLMWKAYKVSRYRHLRLDSRLQFATFVLLYIFVIAMSIIAHLWSDQVTAEQTMVNTFLMTAVLFVIRKSLVIEQHAIPEIRKDIVSILRAHHAELSEQIDSLYRRIKSAIPLANVEYIPDSEAWHHKAISMVHAYKASPVSIEDREGIFAISSYFDTERANQVSDIRQKYFSEIATICCDEIGKQMSYALIIATGNDEAIRSDLQARTNAFDQVGWTGSEFQVKKARISGLDLLTAGNEILFSLRTAKGAQATRKGIYIRDKSTSVLFHRWFFATYTDPSICEEISSEDADRWGLTGEQKEKLNVSTDKLKTSEHVAA